MFVPGQRWISTTEPELGLGTVLRVEGRHLQILFAKAGVLRPYASDSAPLIRAEFRAGQRVAGKGIAFIVERVEVQDELLIYRGEGRELHEGQLDDEQSLSQADDRLIGGRTGSAAQFELRLETLRRRADARRSPTWGLASARIGLIPHQLQVAGIAAARRRPRVLLADEVGLGKTIEAGLIIARLLATGRAGRVLILLPEPLIYQWFVELRRRFHLDFSIYDTERLEALGGNPFDDEQRVIADFSLFENAPERRRQLLDAGWDLLVVDEAHHLSWSPEAASPAYQLVEALATHTPGVILLSATPEQLGRSGHFARLRLLDPERYTELAAFDAETARYQQLSAALDALREGRALSAAEHAQLAAQIAGDPPLEAALAAPSTAQLRDLQAALIDRHGPGRAMFRHRRASIGGFPERRPEFNLIDPATFGADYRAALLAEFHSDVDAAAPAWAGDLAADPRLEALRRLLEAHPQDKFLLICRSQAKVLALEAALRTRSPVACAKFFEGLSLIQRDRAAAYFAQADGARLLLCSEIGSEGRNFQFVHRLILWDLPLDPDLLEQRIGRLDRIGQQHPIELHLLLVAGSAQHALARWYHEGLDAFCHTSPAARELLSRFAPQLLTHAAALAQGEATAEAAFAALLAATQAAHRQLRTHFDAGRDRLLEQAASRDPHATDLLQAFRRDEDDPSRDAYILRLFEQFGVHAEDLGQQRLLLDPQYLTTDALPGFEEGPCAMTFSRELALAREDLPLMRLDHPQVNAAMELMLESEDGNAAFMVDDLLGPRTALLQAVFVLECVADRRLDVTRFLPALPLSVTVDTRLAERIDFAPSELALRKAGERTIEVPRYRKFLAKLVPPMLERAEALGRQRGDAVIADAGAVVQQTLEAEWQRLRALSAINSAIHDADLDAIAAERDALLSALQGTRLRLDAVRFVVSPDFLALR